MNIQDIESLFLELIQIDSHSLHEGGMAKKTSQFLQKLGFHVQFDNAGEELGGETGNVIATLPGDGSKSRILLAAHMDTVEPGVGVKPRVENGVVYSDGTTVLGADDKAGVTAILIAMNELIESGKPHGQIQVVFTIAEEIGLLGAKNLDTTLLQSDIGLSLDSGGKLGTLVVAGPAQVKWSAEFLGRAAHAGVAPERGLSAIKLAAGAVAKMPHGRIDAETTVNVGSFVGEGPTNVVRDKVRLLGEARSRNSDKLDQILSDIEVVFQQTAQDFSGKADFHYQKMYDGFRFVPGDPLRSRIEQALVKAGFEPTPMESGGGSDANIYTSYGVPTMNIGIGYEDIHSVHEKIQLADIQGAAKVILEFCTLE